MKRVLHITREMSTIEYDATVPCLIDTIREPLSREEIKEHLNTALEWAIKKAQLHEEIGWIANTMYTAKFPTEAAPWISEDLTLQLANAGIRYFAKVLSETEWVNISNDFFDISAITIKNGIAFRNFRDLEAASKWLHRSLK